jgi:hypothetical protein
MQWILRRHAKQILGELSTIEVKPSLVGLYAYPPGYKWTKLLVRKPFGNVWAFPFKVWSSLYSPPGNWDLESGFFNGQPTYLEMHDLWQHAHDWRQSMLYQKAAAELVMTGGFRYKKTYLQTAQELDDFFENYLVGMIHSMKQNGYDKSKASDNPGVMIGRNGELIKSPRGRHRWAVASVLGIGGVASEIDCIHPDWISKVQGGWSGDKLHRLREAIQKVQQHYQ